jgi:alkanesulfonate monooxygenase SsuD/methylene tetrahydromethanopterin reductase-like flavin-dependent oxidoreductase (luciferase family)
MALEFGIFVPPFADFAEPERMVELGVAAEEAGWDGLFLWDHMLAVPGMAVADSWVTAAAIAQATSRIRLGMMVTPLARRRPWVLARETATLDRLSKGRLVVGVGLGDDGWSEFSSFSGEPVERAERARLLDETLEVLRAFWSGEPVEFEGERVSVHSGAFLPRPVQDPLPIWVAARAPHRRPLERAARHQGCFPLLEQGDPPLLPEPEDVARLKADLVAHGAAADIDIVCRGATGLVPDDTLAVGFAELEAAGMTWWLDSYAPGEPADEVLEIIGHGPPG